MERERRSAVPVQMLADPPRSLAQRRDVRRVALFGRDLFEILSDESEELAEAGVAGTKVAEKFAVDGFGHSARVAPGDRSTCPIVGAEAPPSGFRKARRVTPEWSRRSYPARSRETALGAGPTKMSRRFGRYGLPYLPSVTASAAPPVARRGMARDGSPERASRSLGALALSRAPRGARVSTRRKENPNMLEITEKALVSRINRKLAHEGQAGEGLRKSRSSRARDDLGDFYVLDFSTNVVTEKDVDPERLGRKLGVLKPGEAVKS
jgi:hypothetical protein